MVFIPQVQFPVREWPKKWQRNAAFLFYLSQIKLAAKKKIKTMKDRNTSAEGLFRELFVTSSRCYDHDKYFDHNRGHILVPES